ncbi:N-carbamoyl-L-amino-acid hydrolase [Haladaptatus litoreus]|uniref:N-carbamoyl-L-amino-acid hydrolase n=1 Tax=Haladaptatus litoreus TaxID=553468 RepID=A0A1N7CL35_9EURY|nr:Zn-dependent hydrolase [Haladaptatus litoreus]SIR64280.1 N-carbamoyl-L-amino-acid hydrolase [Haladaptatus litoreus]
MQVDAERLQCDLETNAQFGSVAVDDGHARTVLTGTDADERARDYFVRRLRDAEMDVRIDAVGNIVGRWVPETADSDSKAVATGSHLDSVPEGGIFDGPLGVYASLEAVRAMQDANLPVRRPIEVVCFTEEEGQRFGVGALGSAVATESLSIDEAHTLTDEHGTTLETALDSIDFLGDGRIRPEEWDSWLELHIEQDTRLEAENTSIGVVTAITGIARCAVSIVGEANHAGTTSMAERTDALAAASTVVNEVETAAIQLTEKDAPTAVATVGSLNVSPNAPNVVPGRVDFTVDIRDVSHESMLELIDHVRASLNRVEAERTVETSFSLPRHRKPRGMSERCRRAVHETATEAEISATDLHSGAAHDTMRLEPFTDVGLLFAPSQDGISHNPLEWTDWGDCADSAEVLAGSLFRLSNG